MRPILLAAALLAATPALAQQQPPPDPTQMALGQTLSETIGALVRWRAQAIADEQTIAEMKKKAETAKPPAHHD